MSMDWSHNGFFSIFACFLFTILHENF